MNKLPGFADFFHALWEYPPFPWQTRLAKQLETQDKWPRWVGLPTGMGKTTCLDIAVYHLATQAHLSIKERAAPVRIVFAVNRRIVVDEAFERARAISERLSSALTKKHDPLQPIASALRELAGDEDAPPLEAFPLRGATFTDRSWARTPTQPLILTTTLDQLGSRLLFRGYGVSKRSWPIDAALLANDALLILDEAHTSPAFSQTLEAVSEFRKVATEPLPVPFHSVQLTATPPLETDEAPFNLDYDDCINPVIKQRINAPKISTLQEVPGVTKNNRHKLVGKNLARGAIELLNNDDIRNVLVVANRVATAEETVIQLQKELENDGGDVGLLTGRLRPLDRQNLISWIDEKLVQSGQETKPFVLVATQCIEVGADYDFDGLVSELAPLDALRQRFGRINRRGREDLQARAIICGPSIAIDPTKEDPLYGDCLPKVWNFLGGIEDLDFGIAGFAPCLESLKSSETGDKLEDLISSGPDALVLLPPHLDLLCQTNPTPHVEPDPALYIHGPRREFPEVYVVIRADLDANSSQSAIESVPPNSVEAATVPLYLAKNWLNNPSSFIDIGGDAPHPPGEFDDSNRGEVDDEIHAWRYREKEASLLAKPEDLRPGDFLVLPANSDNLSGFVPGLSKNATAWELDQCELAFLVARDKLRIRFHRKAAYHWKEMLTSDQLQTEFQSFIDPLFKTENHKEEVTFNEAVWREKFSEIALFLAKNLPGDCCGIDVWKYAAATPPSGWFSTPYPDELGGAIMMNRSRVGFTKWPLDPGLGEQNEVGTQKVLLDQHNRDVGKRASLNALGLGEMLENTLREAGLWHDIGKLDLRFQALLHGCSPLTMGGKNALAKSADGLRSKSVRDFYYLQSELPKGFRHELISALIVAQADLFRDDSCRDLLLHLIASHHGYCRALAPLVQDSDPQPIETEIHGQKMVFPGAECPMAHINDGVSRRFWKLTRRYGWWGLAYLEALIRLADQRESARFTEG